MTKQESLDREYMLSMIDDRISFLNLTYRKACAGKDVYGNEIGYANARAKRYYSKKDLNLLNLIKYLLENSNIEEISNEGMIDAFDKIVEPRVLR